MKNLKFPFLLLFILAFSNTVFSQMRYKGKVVDIVDGKTVIIEVPPTQNRLTAELQAIEVPEPEQELHATVKEHLRKLLVGREVLFVANQMKPQVAIGRLTANGVDISQQMLRDGAAWYAFAADAEKQNRTQIESQNYQNAEGLAKQERRGVWGIADLKPAWEFRAEKAALKRKLIEEEEKRKKALAEQSNANYTRPQIDAKRAALMASQKLGIEVWDEHSVKGKSGLLSKFDQATNAGYLSTPMMRGELSDGKSVRDLLVVVAYKYTGQPMPKSGKTLYLTIGNLSENKNFLRGSKIAVYIDEETKMPLGKSEVKVNDKAEEVVTYQVSRATLEKLIASDQAFISVGAYKKPLDESILKYIKQVLEATK